MSIPNEKAARLTREIMRLSLALALIQLGFVFYNSIALDQNYFFVQGFLVWLLPFCGYCKLKILFVFRAMTSLPYCSSIKAHNYIVTIKNCAYPTAE